RKVFISNIHNAKWGVVWARTDKAKGRAGISCFILEPGTPGVTWKNIRTIRTASIPNDVVFEDCALPLDALIGQAGQGLDLVFDAAVQIHGGYGVSKEFPLERWYREARVRRIGEGPSEVHRMVIARSLFR